jgi:Histone-like transcription factor (CBF/NF-Y) and archaeal histone
MSEDADMGPKAVKLDLPLARVKNLMKTDKEVQKVSQEATWLIARSTELLIQHLVSESYRLSQARNSNAHTLKYDDLGVFLNFACVCASLRGLAHPPTPFCASIFVTALLVRVARTFSAECVQHLDELDFLQDIVPRAETLSRPT